MKDVTYQMNVELKGEFYFNIFIIIKFNAYKLNHLNIN